MPSYLLPFLDIESSIQNLVYKNVEGKIKDVLKTVRTEMEEGRDVGALEALHSLDFTDETEASLKNLDFFMVNALIYGSSLAGPAHESLFIKQDNLPKLLKSVKTLYQKIAQTTTLEYIIEQGSNIINARIEKRLKSDDVLSRKLDQAFIDELNAAVLGGARIVNDIAGNLTTSRLVSYGFLAEARVRGITRYQLQAILDEKTSEVCARLHGRTFQVEKSFTFLEEVLQIEDPEQLKAMAPFVPSHKASLHNLENMSSKELQSMGVMVPPFHPHCRTICVRVGAVDTQVDYKPVDILISEKPVVYRFESKKEFRKFGKDTMFVPKPNDVKALMLFEDSDKINEKLRKKGLKDLSSKDLKQVRALDRAMKKSELEKDIVVYRAINSLKSLGVKKASDLDSAIIIDKGYVSTTGLQSIATSYAKESTSGAVLEIIVPAGANYVVPNVYTQNKKYSDDFEVILPRGSKFVVADVIQKWKSTKVKGKTVWIPKIVLKWYK